MNKTWTPEQERILRDLVSKVSMAEIGKRVGKSAAAVHRKTHRMGIASQRVLYRRPWDNKEISDLWRYAGTMAIPMLARRMRRTEAAIRCKMDSLGIECRQGRVTLVEASKILGCDRKQIRKYLCEYRAGRSPDGLIRGVQYHMTHEEIAGVAQLMLDTGTMRSISALTLRKVIQEFPLQSSHPLFR